MDERARDAAAAKASDEARRRSDAEAESRAARHYANGSSCSSAYTADAGSCGRGVPIAGQSVDVSNRAEVARLLRRLQALDAAPSASPTERAWLKSLEPALRAADARFAEADRARAEGAARSQARAAAEKARVDSIVRPHDRPDTLERLSAEILRLRCVPTTSDAALGTAVAARITELTNEWCAKARAAGMSPPGAGFDPYLASDRDLQSAFLWITIAGAVPLDAARHDGGVELREDVFEAVALRTPGLGDQLIDSYAGDPGMQRLLLERELRRLGEPRCSASATNEQLVLRRAELLRQRHYAETTPDPNARYIGLDGLQGTLETTVDYEIEQRIVAMNPGSVAGTYYAMHAALHGASIEQIRAAGQAGNAIGGLAGALAGVDQRKLGPGPVDPALRGRRRVPPGPGLGRRTRVAQSTRPRAQRAAQPTARADGSTASTATRSDAAASRTPIGFDDKHVLNGEVKRSPAGTPRAVGFHHQAPGTESKGRIVPGTEEMLNSHGVYRASVEIKDERTGQWVRKSAQSTFFPKHWTRSEVRTAILEAYANREELGDGEWRGRLPNGMMIRGAVDPTGRITTAYPDTAAE